MPQMNFDLEDGLPPVSFVLKPEDCARFASFLRECDEGKKNAERYRWLKQQFRVMSLNMSGNHVWVQASSNALRGPDMDAACDAGMALHNARIHGPSQLAGEGRRAMKGCAEHDGKES